MIVRSVKCTLINQTGEPLTLDAGGTKPNEGAWGPEPPEKCDQQVEFTCLSNGSKNGAQGQATYTGPSGSVVMTWWNPLEGSNQFEATPSDAYLAGYTASVGREATVVYTVKKKVVSAGDQDGMPTAVDTDPPADDHTRQSHVPLRASGPVVLSPKLWLIDVAWQAVNHLEWDPLILEITENRHGEGSGGACPQNLVAIDGVKAGSPGHETCKAKHSGLVPDDFYSWCGDYVSWVFWKAWMLKRGNKPDEETRKLLVKFLNREALRSSDQDLKKDQRVWQSGKNLTMFEDFAKDSAANGGLLRHIPFKLNKPEEYEPQPGDVIMANRASGGHIDVVAYYNPASFDKKGNHNYITLDGKSFDMGTAEFDWGKKGTDPTDGGWFNPKKGRETEDAMPPAPFKRESSTRDRTQGVVQTHHLTSDMVVVGKDKSENDIRLPFISAFIDTSKLREKLGYR